jgi:hypothetical protein
MAEQLLDRGQIATGFKQVGREGMAQRMEAACLVMPARSLAIV